LIDIFLLDVDISTDDALAYSMSQSTKALS